MSLVVYRLPYEIGDCVARRLDRLQFTHAGRNFRPESTWGILLDPFQNVEQAGLIKSLSDPSIPTLKRGRHGKRQKPAALRV